MVKHAANAGIDELLQAPLSEVIPADRQVVFVHESSTVQVALEMLAKHRILALPVIRPDKDSEKAVTWVGFVSYVNLIRFFGSKVDKNEFLNSTLIQVMKFSKNAPLQVEERSRVIDAVEFFGSLGGLHRCGVFNNLTLKKSMCSQSDIVRFVAKRIFDNEERQAFANVKIAEVGWGKRHPVSAREDESLQNALNTLIQKNVSCVAVVDKNGSLKGNFSASDLRGLGEELLDELSTPLGEFLAKHSPASLKPKSEAVTQSIGVLLSRMSQQRLHHVWLEDPEGKPEGLVTLTDIMNLLIQFTPPTQG